MSDLEMMELLDKTMAAQFEADTYSSDDPTRASPNAGATEDEIARFANYLRHRGLPLPPSFAQFLRLCNGIRDFIPSMGLSMRSIAEMESSEKADESMKSMTPAYRFIFACDEESGAAAGFLPDTADATGEMAVELLAESGETNRYANFERFLHDQLAYYESIIRSEQADRAGLRDD